MAINGTVSVVTGIQKQQFRMRQALPGIVPFVLCSILHGQILEHISVLWVFCDVKYCLHLQGYIEPTQVPRMASYAERRKQELAVYRD